MLIVDYDENHVDESYTDSIDSLNSYINKSTATWVNINCVCNTELTDSVSSYFGFSRLVKSNLSNQDTWSSLLVYPEYSYISLFNLDFNIDNYNLNIDRICCVLGENILLTFQENSGPLFSKIRERIKESTEIVRRVNVDYLQYLLVNTILDQFTTQLQKSANEISKINIELFATSQELRINCYKLNQLLIEVKSYITTQTLSLNKMIKYKAFIQDKHLCFYEDVHSRCYSLEIELKSQIEQIKSLQLLIGN